MYFLFYLPDWSVQPPLPVFVFVRYAAAYWRVPTVSLWTPFRWSQRLETMLPHKVHVFFWNTVKIMPIMSVTCNNWLFTFYKLQYLIRQKSNSILTVRFVAGLNPLLSGWLRQLAARCRSHPCWVRRWDDRSRTTAGHSGHWCLGLGHFLGSACPQVPNAK